MRRCGSRGWRLIFAPAGEEQSSDWGAAMEMYRALYDRFVQEFGEQAIKRVYLVGPT